ncbi:MAG: DUF1931 domain-containing protein [Candidatus Aenigmatarchaeota archaeon]
MAKEANLVVKSAVREVAGDVRISDEFFDALNKKVVEMVKEAVKRAEANGRKTLRAADV